MADESGGLVDDEQAAVLKNDFKKFFQTREGCQSAAARQRKLFASA
jgi:hypothetical protein